MEIQITQEQVDAIIEREVDKALDNVTFYRYDGYDDYEYVGLDRYVKEAVEDKIDEYLKKKFGALIDEEVSHVASHEVMAEFLARPVKITDGYRQAEYESYASYLLKRIHEHSLKSWDIQGMIRKEIEVRVERLWEQCEKDAKDAAIASFSAKIGAV